MDKKIVFFDYDGTLVDEAENIFSVTAQTKAALAALRKNGHMAILATGRSFFYLPKDIIALFDGCITCNGAAAHINNKQIYCDYITGLPFNSLISYLAKHNIACGFEQDTTGFYGTWNYNDFSAGFKVLGVDSSAFLPLNPATDNLNFCKCMMFFNSSTQLNDFCSNYASDFEVRLGKGGKYVDFNAKGMHKGYGVAKVLAHLNINISCAIAIGDGENDVEMLAASGIGVAMGKHHQALDSVASIVTQTVANEGVYTALKQLKLI